MRKFSSIRFVHRTVGPWVKFVLNFIIPNYFIGSLKRVVYLKKPLANQKIFITGLGQVTIGANCIFGYKLGGFFRGGQIEIQPRYKGAKIEIGSNVATNNNIYLCAANRIVINDNTRIGQNVTMMDFEAHGTKPDQRSNLGDIGEINIGSNVWIGNNVTILKNSSVGNNSIVATGSVVNRNFPGNVIIGGIPARILKSID